ncbi:MAG: hypothetical protein IH991_00435, partial [Planctomycetes bacterium]|nr:hypothetical protein [Planctomycetota bacterium]
FGFDGFVGEVVVDVLRQIAGALVAAFALFGECLEDDGLQFIINPKVSIRTDYTYINSDSNVANLFGVRFFDFDRHLLQTLLIYDF